MTYPAIPEGCERFKIENGVAKFLDGNIWITVVKGLRSGRVSGTAANICNAARCAWLDEAERESLNPEITFWSNHCHFVWALKGNDGIPSDEYPACSDREVDIAWALAWSEAWAREAKGE